MILVLFFTSWFLVYLSTQVTGVLEQSSQCFIPLGLHIITGTTLTDTPQRHTTITRGLCALAFCFWGVLTHERYVVTFVFLGYVFWKRAKTENGERTVLLISASASLLTAFAGWSWISGIPIFVGSFGQTMSINVYTVISYSVIN